MSSRPAARSAHLLGLALGGVLAGHELTYGILEPSSHARRAVALATGHAYLEVANRLVLSLAVAAVAATVLARLLRGAETERGVAWLALRLVPIQVLAFVAMEVAERLVAGAPLHDLAAILPLGLTIQVAFGVLAAAALRSLWRAAGRAAEVLADTATPAARPAAVVLAVQAHPRPLLPGPAHPRPPARAPPFAM